MIKYAVEQFSVPELLYRYRSFNDDNLNILSKLRTWFTRSDKLDDQNEGICKLSLKDSQDRLEKLKKRVYLACFTKRLDNYHMWEDYAHKHTGYCIEYETKNHHINSSDSFNVFPLYDRALSYYLFPIEYIENRYEKDLTKYYTGNTFIPSDLNKASKCLHTIFQLLKSFRYKDIQYRYEEEYRMYIYDPTDGNESGYEHMGSYNNHIKNIYVGYQTSEVNINKIKTIINNINSSNHLLYGNNPINLYQLEPCLKVKKLIQ